MLACLIAVAVKASGRPWVAICVDAVMNCSVSERMALLRPMAASSIVVPLHIGGIAKPLDGVIVT